MLELLSFQHFVTKKVPPLGRNSMGDDNAEMDGVNICNTYKYANALWRLIVEKMGLTNYTFLYIFLVRWLESFFLNTYIHL